jgi:hypothetical protein
VAHSKNTPLLDILIEALNKVSTLTGEDEGESVVKIQLSPRAYARLVAETTDIVPGVDVFMPRMSIQRTTISVKTEALS